MSTNKIVTKIQKEIKSMNFNTNIITDIGSKEVEDLKEISTILDKPIRDLVNPGDTTQNFISTNLVKIKTEADKINPAKFDFNQGFLGRMISKITGSSRLGEYATKFVSVKENIESINNSLSGGVLVLEKDINDFEKESKRFRTITKNLKEKIVYLEDMRTEITKVIEETEDLEVKKALQEKVLYELNTHVLDLLAVESAAMQGIASIDILIKNNKTLVKGVNRARNVAIPVLTIGFVIASGISNQKKILNVVQSVNKSSSEIMLKNAEMLKSQGMEIQKQATESLLDLSDMQKAVETLISSIEEVETFKVASLPKMQESIKSFNELSLKLDSKLSKDI